MCPSRGLACPCAGEIEKNVVHSHNFITSSGIAKTIYLMKQEFKNLHTQNNIWKALTIKQAGIGTFRTAVWQPKYKIVRFLQENAGCFGVPSKGLSPRQGYTRKKSISEDRLFQALCRVRFHMWRAVPHPNGTFGYFSRIDVRPQAALPIVQFGGDAVLFVPGL